MADLIIPEDKAASEANKARRLEIQRRYREKHKDRLREKNKIQMQEWRKANPEKAREAQRRSEAKRRGKRVLTESQKERARKTARIRWAANPTESAKKKAKTKAWRAANKERNDARDREYRERNAEKVAEWRATSKSRKLHLKWYAANPEKHRQRAKQLYWSDPDKGRAAARAWVKNHPEKAKVIWAAQGARRKGAPGHFTAADIERIRKAQDNRCAYCRKPLGKNVQTHIDHIQPIARGGSNDPRNLQLLCAACNMSKKAKDPIDFAQSLGLLL
jgi:hypothetical protein